MITVILLGLFIILSVAAVWKLKKITSFWEETSIPHHTFFEYLKEEWTRTRVPYNEYAIWRYKRIPKVFGSYMGLSPKLIIADRELIKQVLVKDFMSFSSRFAEIQTNDKTWDNMVLGTFGEVWKHQRDVMTPAFTTGKVKQMIPVIAELADRVVGKFVEDSRNGVNSDLKQLYSSFTMDTVAKLAFATDLNSRLDTENRFVKHAEGLFGPENSWKFPLLWMFPNVFRFMRLQLIRDKSVQFLKSVVTNIIQQREKQQSKEATDLLQLLLNSLVTDDSEATSNGTTANPRKGLSMEEIISQAIMFFMVALDTTSTGLIFTTYLLATNPEAQDKLIEEVDRVIGTGPVTYDAVVNMPYLEGAINETLRIVGTDPFVLRNCTRDTTLAGIPYKEGMFVEVSMHGIHNDPEYFPEPEKFKPERFLPENKASIESYTFFPFGEGPRHCLGMRLAMFEMKVCLSKVFQKIRFETCPETTIPVKFARNCFIPESELPLVLRPVERS